MDIKQLCITLAEKRGVAGDEGKTAEYLCSLLEKYMPCEIDALGSVIGKKQGKGKSVLLDAHIDRVGLIVTYIDEDGFVHFDKCGGADLRVLTGCEVTVYAKQELFGVICSVPPHLISDKSKGRQVELKNLAVDLGMTKDEVCKIVSAGDRISYRAQYYTLNEDMICGAGFDDRCGVAAILLCLEMLKENGVNALVEVQFSVQEEKGKAGAQTAAYKSTADECIAVDVGFACQPGVRREEGIVMGDGASICFSPILDTAMCLKLKQTAEENDIPFQCDATGDLTHTDADAVSIGRGGVKCALLSIPLRSMHTACEMISIKDVEATARLLYEYIRSGSEENE
ncbi:MAG: M20/M25/M40 family metallo-hydrolase [Clostridia bacterium]|nr:M20/M25/M40 family metallo-hydrolase [Clostridia bacterium]